MRKKRTYERPVSEMVQINAHRSLMAASGGKDVTVGGSNMGPMGPTTEGNPDEIDAKDNNNIWGNNVWED